MHNKIREPRSPRLSAFTSAVLCGLTAVLLLATARQGIRSDLARERQKAEAVPRSVPPELKAALYQFFPRHGHARGLEPNQAPPWAQAQVVHKRFEFEALLAYAASLSDQEQQSLLRSLRAEMEQDEFGD